MCLKYTIWPVKRESFHVFCNKQLSIAPGVAFPLHQRTFPLHQVWLSIARCTFPLH